MLISFKKINTSNHKLEITRSDKSIETVILDTKTYMLHDVCHFFVEKELNTYKGFWGMLSRGYKTEDLIGKTNPLTKNLRKIECIVGATQSVYSKKMTPQDFKNYIQTVDEIFLEASFLEKVIPKIDDFMLNWKYLKVTESCHLEF